jgi:hypothetical protein
MEHPITPQRGGEEGANIKMSIFDEQYRVVAIEGDRLFIRGVKSGDVLVIVNPEPETPLSQEDYPMGKLIALSDPAAIPEREQN